MQRCVHLFLYNFARLPRVIGLCYTRCRVGASDLTIYCQHRSTAVQKLTRNTVYNRCELNRRIMEIKQSILQEFKEYAELFQNDFSEYELVVDLTLMIYSHPELQDLPDHRIKGIIEEILDDL